MWKKSPYSKAFRAIVLSGLAAATMFAARALTRKKGRSREIPVE